MFLRVENRSHFLDLHLKTCLDDWDMSEEVKLATTTDQFYQDDNRNEQGVTCRHCAEPARQRMAEEEEEEEKEEKEEAVGCEAPYERPEYQVEPSLWLVVNPAVACSVKYPKEVAHPPVPPLLMFEGPPEVAHAVPSLGTIPCAHPPSPAEESSLDVSLHEASSSSEYMVTDEDDVSSVDIQLRRKVKSCQRLRLTKEKIRKLGMAQSKRLQRVLQESNYLKSGVWPRPPVNYCILIAMALSSSHSGSLNVQQIYNFTREHFPFFQTAPDGWKNTIRHNLCFSNSFKKTQQQVSSEGKRKSCLWHLTLDGRRRLRDEIHTLSGESFRVLRRSMNNPDMIQALFDL